MKRLVWLLAALVCAGSGFAQSSVLEVKKLRCEYKTDPMGIDVAKPRLSWQLNSNEKNVLQTSYEVRVSDSQAALAQGKTVWTSGKQISDESTHVEYAGAALQSGRAYYWQVRVGDNHGHISEWSQTARWEMGLLGPTDWKAKWITPNLVEDDKKSNPSPLLRREFTVKKKVASARLYVSAMGLYEMELNGKRVGDEVKVRMPGGERTYEVLDITFG